jgi:hypothetical protein
VPSKLDSDGTPACEGNGFSFDCTLDAAGQCAWVTTCDQPPAACTPERCGKAPSPTDADGSPVCGGLGFTMECTPDSAGECAWMTECTK